MIRVAAVQDDDDEKMAMATVTMMMIIIKTTWVKWGMRLFVFSTSYHIVHAYHAVV